MNIKRAKKLETLKSVVENSGEFTIDSCGNFVSKNNIGRIKFKKVSVRFEKKYDKKWYNLKSFTWNKLSEDEFSKLL